MSDRVQHNTMEDAKNFHLKSLGEALLGDAWACMVWKVEDGKLHALNLTTWKFPMGDFENAVKLLENKIEELKREEIKVDPLPLAPHLSMDSLDFKNSLEEVKQEVSNNQVEIVDAVEDSTLIFNEEDKNEVN